MMRNICLILLILIILYFSTDSKVKNELFGKYKFIILLGALLFLLGLQNGRLVEGTGGPGYDDRNFDDGPQGTGVRAPPPSGASGGEADATSCIPFITSESCIPFITSESCTTFIDAAAAPDATSCDQLIESETEALTTRITDLTARLAAAEAAAPDATSCDQLIASETEALTTRITELTSSDCVGTWSECDEMCSSEWKQTTAATGNGTCLNEVGEALTTGDTRVCHRGESDDCPECLSEKFEWFCPVDDEGEKLGKDPLDTDEEEEEEEEEEDP